MAVGSVLSVTDPSAVIGILKSTGAREALTVQITCESVMNQGTAIILFVYFFDQHMDWVDHDAASLLKFFLQMGVIAPISGLAVGVFGYLWMASTSRKYIQTDLTTQICITLIIAFFAFYSSEQEYGSTGVLATNAAGLALTRFVWPIVCSRDSLESFWRVLEYFAKTLIFILAGVMTHRALSNMDVTFRDCGWCVGVYVILMFIRGMVVCLSYPLLSRIGTGSSPTECAFMVWGGLRGSIGLAFAIFARSALLESEQGAPGDQVLFLVAGTALLTQAINASTARFVLRSCVMKDLLPAKEKLLSQVQGRVRRFAQDQYYEICVSMNHDAVEAIDSLPELRGLQGTPHERPVVSCLLQDRENGNWRRGVSKTDVSDAVAHLESKLAEASADHDAGQLAVLRQAFMRIVRSKYWELMQDGKLPKTSPATLKLLDSVVAALNDLNCPLHDWKLLRKSVQWVEGGIVDRILWILDAILPQSVNWGNELHYYFKVKNQQSCYHAVVSFITAHLYAQDKIAEFFNRGDGGAPETPEEVKLILESAYQVQEAQDFLSKMGESLISVFKSSIVTHLILQRLSAYVSKLVAEGVITEADSQQMIRQMRSGQQAFHEIQKAKSSRLLQARRSNSRFSTRSSLLGRTMEATLGWKQQTSGLGSQSPPHSGSASLDSLTSPWQHNSGQENQVGEAKRPVEAMHATSVWVASSDSLKGPNNQAESCLSL
eukprot:TRINITY_DN23353_c0_g1_i1.p1 TRINITY_DN23353_c0_g1~~TRINITY_DN23353_c0_g1_i1.p1  ORF type:complete len:814 (-),score=89.90 TRINITY_DN23353_c0_g1_i1:507-2657(-)